MKAVFINEHGGTDKLICGDRPEPEVGPGEIMLRVRASALNHLDLNLREGRTYRAHCPASSAATSPARWLPSARRPIPTWKSATA